MKAPITLPVIAIAVLLSMGGLASRPASAQAAPADDSATQSGQPATDTWITTKVKAELASTKGVNSTDISVTTSNGVVVLTGVVANDIAVQKATAAAQSVKGVTKVDASGLKAKD
jgi:hyperosmotically inducible periplasmic protein